MPVQYFEEMCPQWFILQGKNNNTNNKKKNPVPSLSTTLESSVWVMSNEEKRWGHWRMGIKLWWRLTVRRSSRFAAFSYWPCVHFKDGENTIFIVQYKKFLNIISLNIVSSRSFDPHMVNHKYPNDIIMEKSPLHLNCWCSCVVGIKRCK